MLESMTGFGQSETQLNGAILKIEIKSLNSKFLDLNVKLPRTLSARETDIRGIIQTLLKRGKISLMMELVAEDGGQNIAINEQLLRAYFLKYKKLAGELAADQSDLFKLALQSPEVMNATDKDMDLDWNQVKNGLEVAAENCTEFRKEEGANLAVKLREYVAAIGTKLEQVEALDGKRIENIRARIDRNLADIRERVQVDENRFEQELIYYIEKLDITEEKVRLTKHLSYFLEVMSSEQSEGKKLGFIGQEMGREINTIGSKANDPDIQQLVVEMKDELEKIKEQLLNIM